PPAPRDREHLIAPFRHKPFVDQHLDDLVERRRDRGTLAAGNDAQRFGARLDRPREAPQHLGVVAAHEAYARLAEEQRQEAVWPIGIAGVDVAQQAHAELRASVRLREARTTFTPTF